MTKFPVGILSFVVNNENTRTMCKIYLTHCSGVFIVDFEQVNAGWVNPFKLYIN